MNFSLAHNNLLDRYTMSVKDQLEQSHVDGSHTTVKSKRSTNTGVASQFNKEAAWQVQQYGDYAGTLLFFCSLCVVCVAAWCVSLGCMSKLSLQMDATDASCNPSSHQCVFRSQL